MGTRLVQGIPSHVAGLIKYLSCPEERANEDLAVGYFRYLYPETFKRQQEAKNSDGYVPGSFVLELKGRTNDWLSGFFQALAYRNVGLDFSQIVVGAKDFLALWRVDNLPQEIREATLSARGAPNAVGNLIAKKYSGRRGEILKLAIWNGAELSGSLFQLNPAVVMAKIGVFEESIRRGRKVRLKITTANFVSALKEMKQFFSPEQPVKTVRAFYSMVHNWSENSVVKLSERNTDQATLEGELITDLIPTLRGQFKDFVETRYIHLAGNENIDDFFARYDEAIDAVARAFRVKHGMFFTDPYLSKFVMWLVRRDLPNLGKNYLVIDPACGSGNLVTNWRSPLEIRHKVVSEIEPELLFAVERRMQGDKWHHGKFTVVPKVSENIGLNFLDRSAESYLTEITKYLHEKGYEADKPIAFLCNPPYRSDDVPEAGTISYEIHESIRELTGKDAENERYCCFLAQMKLICEKARSSGLPGDSLLLLFTKSAWLTRRSMFSSIRSEILACFENLGGILINGAEFFHVKGTWPVAFTMWRYRGANAGLDGNRVIPLRDLTWLTKKQLSSIRWSDDVEVEQMCGAVYAHSKSSLVDIGQDRTGIREWTGERMLDFKRDRRRGEVGQQSAGGLPIGDRRAANKKVYGESNGTYVGFMDDLTPCRIKRSIADRPWFRLNSQFMDAKKNRCFSGPPDNRGFCAKDLDSAKKLFFWFALARTFLQHPYPMWIDSDDMWQPTITQDIETRVYQTAFAIGYAENECVETTFPSGNPLPGTPELVVSNPLTPLDSDSFWSKIMKPYCCPEPSTVVRGTIRSVDQIFLYWKTLFRNRTELPISKRPYLVGSGGLTIRAGLVQIRDYAREVDDLALLQRFAEMQAALRNTKAEFFALSQSSDGFDYFGQKRKRPASAGVPAPLSQAASNR